MCFRKEPTIISMSGSWVEIIHKILLNSIGDSRKYPVQMLSEHSSYFLSAGRCHCLFVALCQNLLPVSLMTRLMSTLVTLTEQSSSLLSVVLILLSFSLGPHKNIPGYAFVHFRLYFTCNSFFFCVICIITL